MKTKRGVNSMAASVLVLFIILLPVVLHSAEYHIPAPVATVQGQDFSVWEQVCEPGFGNINNIAVIAMAEYQGRLYALTRNDAAGVEVWRTSGTSWEQVSFPGGIKNGIYGNTWINNHMGAMVVFKDKALLRVFIRYPGKLPQIFRLRNLAL